MTPYDVPLAAVLVWVAAEDALRFRIRNVAILAVVACMLAAWAGDGLRDVLGHAALGAIALGALLAAFARGWIGGGDAKLLVAALTFVGPRGALLFSLLLLAASSVYSAGARVNLLPFRRHHGRTQIPFGPSIAVAWIAFLALR